MALKERQLARWADGGWELRPAPLRVVIGLPDLTARDGHALRGTLAIRTQVVDRPADRKMLEEAFGRDGDGVDADDVAAHFAPALRAAAAELVATRDGEQWLSAGHRRELIDALVARAKAVTFSAGLDVLPPYQLDLESPTLERQRVHALERQLAERRAASQAEQLQRAAEMLRQFKELRDAAPELPAGRLLEQFSPTDRGAILETLLMGSGETTTARPLLAAAGTALIRITPGDDGTLTRQLIDLPDTVGPLRSVQMTRVHDRCRLLAGARSGVLCIDPDEPANVRAYHDGGVRSPLGFNRVVIAGERIWASHGEGGIVAWDLDDPNESALTVRPDDSGGPPGAGGPRNLQVLDAGRLVYSAGARIHTITQDGTVETPATGSAEIVALIVLDHLVVAAQADGQVLSLERQSLAPLARARRCGPVSSATSLPWLGDQRLLLATQDGPICCVGLDDSLVTQYTSPYRRLKEMAATTTAIAGISPDRQRLVMWKSWEPQSPAELYLASVTRHRIADVTFV